MGLLTLKPPEKEKFLPSLLVLDSSSTTQELCGSVSRQLTGELSGGIYNHMSSPPEDVKPFRSPNESQPSPEVRLQISETSQLDIQVLYSLYSMEILCFILCWELIVTLLAVSIRPEIGDSETWS